MSDGTPFSPAKSFVQYGGTRLFNERPGLWSALLSSLVRQQTMAESAPPGLTGGVPSFWSGNLLQPEGGSPNWNVFWWWQAAEPARQRPENRDGCLISSESLLVKKWRVGALNSVPKSSVAVSFIRSLFSASLIYAPPLPSIIIIQFSSRMHLNMTQKKWFECIYYCCGRKGE